MAPLGNWIRQGMRLSASRSGKAGVIFVANVAAMLTTLLLLAYFSRVMPEAQYGEFRQLLMLITFANAVLQLGYPSTLLQHQSITPDRNQALTSVGMIQWGIAAIWLIFALSLGDWLVGKLFEIASPAAVLWVVLIIAVNILAAIIYPMLLLANAYFSAGVYTLCSLLIPSLGIAVCYAIQPDMDAMFLTYLLCVTATTVVFLAWSVAKSHARIAKPDAGVLPAIFHFGLRLGFGSVFGIGQRYIDKFYVASISGAAGFAIYANGSQEPPLFGALQRSINSVLIPELSVLFNEGKHGRARKIWSSAVIKSHAILFPGACFLAWNAALVIVTLFGEKYRESQYVFLLFTLLIPFRSISFAGILIAGGNARTVFNTSLAGFLATLAFAPLGIYLLGYLGAALAHVMITLLLVVWLTIESMKILQCKFSALLPWSTVGLICLLSIVATLLSSLLPDDIFALPILVLCLKAIVFGLALLALYYRFGFLKEINFLTQSKHESIK